MTTSSRLQLPSVWHNSAEQSPLQKRRRPLPRRLATNSNGGKLVYCINDSSPVSGSRLSLKKSSEFVNRAAPAPAGQADVDLSSAPAPARQNSDTDPSITSPLPIPVPRDRDLFLSYLLEPVEDDLRALNANLRKVISGENPLLMAAGEQIFGASGKNIRPALVFLVSRASAELTGLVDLTPQHRRLAEIIEMIHTASLIHDDVLDESDIRRAAMLSYKGEDSVNRLFGTRVAVLAGDFIFAQTSWLLANLENLEVIKLVSQVIKDFASGEIKQATSVYNCDISLNDYLRKSYCKTASLIAASTKAASIFSEASSDVNECMFDYGKNLGLAFQIVDDILDITRSTEQLGKPAGSDLLKGNLTVPVLFALEQEPRLQELIQSKFQNQGTLETALELVHRSGSIEKAQKLAKEKGDLALNSLRCLPEGSMKSSLEGMVEYVLDRL